MENKNDNLQEILCAISKLDSCLIILSALIEKYSNNSPLVHASIIVDIMREQVDSLMDSSDYL